MVFGVYSVESRNKPTERKSQLKTLTMWIGALLFGAVGGILGQRFSAPKSLPEAVPAHRGAKFELTDASGRVVSVWAVDQWGRPYLGMSDAKWEGRIIIGPILRPDIVGKEPPESDAWGVEITAPGRTAHAVLGTSVPLNSKQPTGFVSLQGNGQYWTHDAAR